MHRRAAEADVVVDGQPPVAHVHVQRAGHVAHELATLVVDARHSWLDALSSAGALVGLIAVAAGQPLGDPVAGLGNTAVICHVG